jgi:sugar-specific transcriptional regulator TrmB
MEKYIKLLERLGIGEQISRVYLDLLEHGTSSIADISRRTELHRIEVYRAIPYLEEEKLITPIERGKRTLYRPLSPERIYDMIRDFERRNTPVMDELMNKYEKL